MARGRPFCMPANVRTVEVPEADRRELARRGRGKGGPSRVVERARIVLLAADGVPGKQIAAVVGCAEGTVVTWRGRYAEHGLPGLDDLPRPGKPPQLPEALRDRVLELTLTEPPDSFGATHWSTRLLAGALTGGGTPISHAPIARTGTASACSRGGNRPSSSPPTRPWRPRSATSSGCTCTRRRRRWCSASMRSRRSRRWNAPPGRCRCAPGRRAADVGLRPARHDHAVRRAGGGHRQGHRGVHRAAPPPGVPGLPPAGRRRLSPPPTPRRGRQPVHPQPPGGARLARPPSTRPLALHPDLGVVA